MKTILALILCAQWFPSLLEAQDASLNTLSNAEKQQGWRLLFDGKTLDGWRSYRQSQAPGKHWVIEDGCLKNPKGAGWPETGGGEILTVEKFTDFDFRFEWRIAPGGNSGVIYFVKERQDTPGPKMFHGDDGTGPVGHEYQLLDDKRRSRRSNPQSPRGRTLHPDRAQRRQAAQTGWREFNQSRILVRGKHVEHWLNGAKILQYELESPSLLQLIAASKYRNLDGFGTKFKTAIQLQDHGDGDI